MKDIEEFAREEAQKNNVNAVQPKPKSKNFFKTWAPLLLVIAFFFMYFAIEMFSGSFHNSASDREHSERKSNLSLCYELKHKSEDCIEQYLKAPKTAEFPDITEWDFRGDGETFAYVGAYVDAENAFGAMLRKEFIIKFEAIDGNYKPVMLVFDGEVIFDYSSDITGEDSP